MTPKDWEAVKGRLDFVGFHVTLNCDGYRLTIERRRWSELRDAYMVYVNGVYKHIWAREDCEERRRFLKPVTVYLWKQAQRRKLRTLSKKALRLVGVNPEMRMTLYEPYWHSFESLKCHVVKNNKEISLWTDPVPPPTAGNEEANDGEA